MSRISRYSRFTTRFVEKATNVKDVYVSTLLLDSITSNSMLRYSRINLTPSHFSYNVDIRRLIRKPARSKQNHLGPRKECRSPARSIAAWQMHHQFTTSQTKSNVEPQRPYFFALPHKLLVKIADHLESEIDVNNLCVRISNSVVF